MHLRLPPPKGRYAKFWVTSVGTGASSGKRSGLNTLGSGQYSGDLRSTTAFQVNRKLSRQRLLSGAGQS